MAIPFQYTRNSGKKCKVFWGVSGTSLNVSEAFASGSELSVVPSDTIILNWSSTFKAGLSDIYEYILLPDRNPDFPDYEYYQSTSIEHDPIAISDLFTITTTSDSTSNPYKYYIYKVSALNTNLKFIK